MKDSIGASSRRHGRSRRSGPGAHRAGRRHQAVRAHRRGHAVGGLAGQERSRRWTYNGTVPGPTLQVDDGDKVAHRAAQRAPGVDVDPLPRSDHPERHGRHHRRHPGAGEAGRPTSPTWFVAHGPAVGMYHSHHDAVKQVPDGLAGAFLVGARARPGGRDRHPAAGHDPRRLGHDRLRPQRQVVPGDGAHRGQARATGSRSST